MTHQQVSTHARAILSILVSSCALSMAPSVSFAQEDPALEDEPALPKPPPTAEEIAAREAEKELTEDELRELDAARDVPLHEKLAWRFGPVFNALYASNQGRPFIYPYVGARYKRDDLYVDVHAPAALGMLDGLTFLFQQRVLQTPRNDILSLFELANETRHLAFFEIAHVRIGQTFTLDPWGTEEKPGTPLRLSVGADGFADFVLFDLPTFTGDLDEIDFDEIVGRDPAVGGVGLFGSVGSNVGPFSGDLALVVARDLLEWDGYEPASGWILSLDADLQIEIMPNLGMYLRPRWSIYTHVPGQLIQTLLITSGIVFSG